MPEDIDGSHQLAASQNVLATDWLKLSGGYLIKVTDSLDPSVLGQSFGARNLTGTDAFPHSFRRYGRTEGVALVQDTDGTGAYRDAIAVGDLLSLVVIATVQYLVKSDILPVAIAREALAGSASADTTDTIEIEVINCPPTPKSGFVSGLTAGEALAAYEIAYVSANNTLSKAGSAVDSNVAGIVAATAINGGVVSMVTEGKFKGIAGATITAGQLLEPGATAGRLYPAAGHVHATQVASGYPTPTGSALNFDESGTEGVDKLQDNVSGGGGSFNSDARTLAGRVVARALEGATTGNSFDLVLTRQSD